MSREVSEGKTHASVGAISGRSRRWHPPENEIGFSSVGARRLTSNFGVARMQMNVQASRFAESGILSNQRIGSGPYPVPHPGCPACCRTPTHARGRSIRYLGTLSLPMVSTNTIIPPRARGLRSENGTFIRKHRGRNAEPRCRRARNSSNSHPTTRTRVSSRHAKLQSRDFSFPPSSRGLFSCPTVCQTSLDQRLRWACQ